MAFLLHDHHRVVNLEEIVADLGRVGVTADVDSGSGLEDRLRPLRLGLGCLWNEFKLRMLLRLLDEIVQGLLHASVSRL